ncbi:MAG: hypothetical protein H5T84_01325 [Thermoleophilia bacterium]|nr:hypothetical protein [Thermoleophilia bacterium]
MAVQTAEKRIQIIVGDRTLTATLNDSATAEAIYSALPIEATVSRWGDEIYFSVPVVLEESPDARQDMAVGELGYWPIGAAFCIFFGPTPVSRGPQPRAYSNVNPFGRIDEPEEVLQAVLGETREGDTVRVEKA